MASASTGTRRDRGVQGVQYTDKRLKMKSGAWVEPQGSLVAFEDFIGDHIAEDSTVTVNQSGTALTAAALSATAGPAPVGHGGWIGGKTDDVDGEIDEVALGGGLWLNPSRATRSPIVCEFG